ncbi:hypothetical protein M378DRAFT_333676 [Amanita muscaria Koide BX008]|uniref:Uncharacterized protein n=1 Tax=Amanita muscaria (strain Koide BX008) TaxID=946122 RepID=A0A0C2S690_AMAMK|nr:hypothetical protein M378DRAFT_333676 [Amanita muscaria Koide BX008]
MLMMNYLPLPSNANAFANVSTLSLFPRADHHLGHQENVRNGLGRFQCFVERLKLPRPEQEKHCSLLLSKENKACIGNTESHQ